MRQRLSAPVLAAAVLAGCAPQSAKVDEGQFTAFLSVSSSRTLYQEVLDLDGFADAGGSRRAVDCRDPDDVEVLPDGQEFCGAIDDFEHELWLEQDGFEVLTLPLEPWRGEAIVTSEGDVQLTFHDRLPGGPDFRFAFVVDPAFQPTQCAVGDDGEGVLEPVDGDWIANWSADLAADDPASDGTLFYLNSGAFQFNPSNTEQVWVLPDRWLAGAAFAKYAQEDFALVATRYGYPSAYASYEDDEFSFPDASELFYAAADPGADPTTDSGYQALWEDTQQVAAEINAELGLILGEGAVAARAHSNAWRVPDANASGLDNWTELNYSWVRFDQPPEELTVGNPATGEVHLFMKSTDSPSRLVVTAKFTVDKIKKDHATLDDLTEQKLEEYGTELCGGATSFE